MPRRNTTRKKIIRRVFHEQFNGGPALLSELRWRVLEAQAEEEGVSFDGVTRSQHVSCNRTIHGMADELPAYHLFPVNGLPMGVGIREAIFRTERHRLIAMVDEGWNGITVCRVTNRPTGEQFTHAPEVSFWLREEGTPRQLNLLHVVQFNTGKPVVVLSGRHPTKRQVRALAHFQGVVAAIVSEEGAEFEAPADLMSHDFERTRREWWSVPPQLPGHTRSQFIQEISDDCAVVPFTGRRGTPSEGQRQWSRRYQIRQAPRR